MMTLSTKGWRGRAVGACLAAAFASVVGCKGGVFNPSPDSDSVRTGTLGNGGFTFRCDDSVACDRYDNADAFPTAIAVGSTFEIGFYLRSGSAGFSYLKDAERGTTLEPVGKYVSREAGGGLAAVTPGIATVIARDDKGAVVDYVTLPVRKPDGLIVYDADYRGSDPERLVSVSLEAGARRSFRTVAQKGLEPLAGLVTVEWTSSDTSIVAVEGYAKGRVTIAGRAPGKATLTAKGASLEQTLEVEVGAGQIEEDAGGGDAAAEGG